MSLNVRSGLGQIPTFAFVPAVLSTALAAISVNVSTPHSTSVTVGNVPGLSLGKFNATAQNNQVVRVLNVPGKPLAAIIADPNFNTRVFASLKALPLAGNGRVHAVVATNTPAPAVSPASIADWTARISGPGVVWYHGFETADEVNNFRWSGGYGSGNDPLARGPNNAALVRRSTTDGTDKGSGQISCMEIGHPDYSGISGGGGPANSYWWRPLGALQGGTTTGNGRGAGKNDPAANGSLTVDSWTPTDGGSAVGDWGAKAIYGNPQYWSTAGQRYDGHELYMQMLVKRDAQRWGTANNRSLTSGKSLWLNRCGGAGGPATLTDQEVVFESYNPLGVGNAGSVSAYRGCGAQLIGLDEGGSRKGQINSDLGSAFYNFPDPSAWITMLVHFKYAPMSGGLGSCTGSNTTMDVWVAALGSTKYTKIWSQTSVHLGYDIYYGHNGVLAAVYNNIGDQLSAFVDKYDQMVFSKNFIACPQAYASGAGSVIGLAAYGLASNASVAFTPQTNIGEASLEWQSAWYHDERNGLVHLLGKQAGNDHDWQHEYYDTSTNAWTYVTANFPNNDNGAGHIYGNTALDTETGDLFQSTSEINSINKIYRWKKSTGTWGTYPVSHTITGPLNDHSNGLAYHPNLYGPGDGGLVIEQQAQTIFIHSSTDTVEATAHGSGVYGDREGIGLWWPAKNCTIHGGSNILGFQGQLAMVTPNATRGGKPVVTALGNPVLTTGGHSATGGIQYGSLHVHPGNPNKLLLVETNGQRAWTATLSGSTLTWTQIGNHPFTNAANIPRIVCSLKAGLGCIWAIGQLLSGTNFSVLWRPAP